MRPSILHWPHALAHAHDRTLLCPTCLMSCTSTWFEQASGCPFCETATPAHLCIRSYDWTGSPLSEPQWEWTRELGDMKTWTLPQRLFTPFSMRQHDHDFLKIEKSDDGDLLLQRLDPGESPRLAVALFDESADEFQTVVSRVRIPPDALKRGFCLRCDGPYPRVLRCWEKEVL